MNKITTTVQPIGEQRGQPVAERITWEHIVIENAYGEQRFISRGMWVGKTYFYVDVQGLTYERYPTLEGSPETFEQLSCGDRWTMCEGYFLNSISGELAEVA